MNAATSLSSAFMRRLARTPLRRRAVLLPSRQLSSTAPVFKQRALPKPLDPYSSSALAALLARLSLPSTPALQQTLMACLTHPSFSAAEAQDTEATTASAQENNELLASLGNSLLGLFASEEIAIRYPQLPSNALSAAVTSYVGPNALSSVARDLGLGVTNKQPEVHANAPAAMPIRWKRTIRSRFPSVNEGEEAEAEIVRRKDNFQEGLASVVRSFVGLVYQEQVCRELIITLGRAQLT
jgi:large subunit ribosomal protein L44